LPSLIDYLAIKGTIINLVALRTLHEGLQIDLDTIIATVFPPSLHRQNLQRVVHHHLLVLP
jgi:hypothetical protein